MEQQPQARIDREQDAQHMHDRIGQMLVARIEPDGLLDGGFGAVLHRLILRGRT